MNQPKRRGGDGEEGEAGAIATSLIELTWTINKHKQPTSVGGKEEKEMKEKFNGSSGGSAN